MRAKRKLLISMLAIVFVLLAVVATIAIAFALTQQTITTTLNIGYVVEDIDGTASATYTIGGVTESLTAMKGDNVIGDTLVFHAGDTEDAGNLMFPEGQIPLSATNDNIVIQYTYSNTGERHYIASMSFDGNISADNMKVEYSINGTDYSTNRYAVVVPANTANKSYWIKISIENKAKSASFTGDFKWLLSGCDEQEDSYLSLTSLEFTGSNGSYAAGVATSGEYAGELVFPGSVNGDLVTTIAYNSSLTQEQKNQVTSVYIPDSVTTIGDNAFENFKNLQTVTFEQNEAGSASAQSGTGLTTIAGWAFNECWNLKEINIPNTVTSLGCTAFGMCKKVETLVIPDGVTYICCAMFYGCENLKNLHIGSGLTEIDNLCTFGMCEKLTNLTVSSENTKFQAIGNCLIYKPTKALIAGCGGSVIPTDGSVTSISANAFYDLKSLNTINIPNTITKIEGGAFFDTTIRYLEIPESVTELGGGFYGANVIAYQDVIELGPAPDLKLVINRLDSSYVEFVKTLCLDYADWGRSIVNVDLTIDTVTEIPSYAFESCTGLKSVNIGDGLTYIYDGAFSCCSGLTEITIPNSVTNINPLAFGSCTNLTSAIFENKTGWVISDVFGTVVSKPVTEDELNDPANAATLLRNTDYYWECVRS